MRLLNTLLFCMLLCITVTGTFGQTLTSNDLVLEQVFSGLGAITDIQNAGDDRLFVASKDGIIRVIANIAGDGDPTLVGTFLNMGVLVRDSGEQGLLGLAFHPNYATNGYFFVNYSCDASEDPNCSSTGNTIIARFTRSTSNPNSANLNSRLVIAELEQPYSNHNGGQIQFKEGYLYIATGDGGAGNDPEESGQDLNSLLGKILRVDVDDLAAGGLPRWGIPPGNPFSDEIWAYGLRNPWRFSFDRISGDMWIGDVGQGAREEVNFQSAASTGGENYGWGFCEGTQINAGYSDRDSRPSNCNCDDTTCYVPPVLEYNRNAGVSLTGGYVYRGTFGELFGIYFYADFGTGTLWGAKRNVQTGILENTIEFNGLSSPTSFGEANNGELYVGTFGGRLYHITPVVKVAICFSGTNQVQTKSRGTIPMRELRIGDEVLTASDKFEPVYSFGHYHQSLRASYLQISTNLTTHRPLELSKDHMVFVQRNEQSIALPASALVVGDQVDTESGAVAVVQKIKTVIRKGAFAPFTSSGTIIVNGIVASSFVSLQKETESDKLVVGPWTIPLSHQWLAHSFESAHRLVCHHWKSYCPQEMYTPTGISLWVYAPLQMSQWMLRQNTFIFASTLLLCVTVLAIVLLVETLVLNPVMTLLVLFGAHLTAMRVGCQNVFAYVSKKK